LDIKVVSFLKTEIPKTKVSTISRGFQMPPYRSEITANEIKEDIRGADRCESSMILFYLFENGLINQFKKEVLDGVWRWCVFESCNTKGRRNRDTWVKGGGGAISIKPFREGNGQHSYVVFRNVDEHVMGHLTVVNPSAKMGMSFPQMFFFVNGEENFDKAINTTDAARTDYDILDTAYHGRRISVGWFNEESRYAEEKFRLSR
jgi:hypothetical protein